MTDLYQEFRNVMEVQFVSVTVDPLIDSESKLKEYADFVGVDDDRWQFIRSDLESTKDLKQNGFMLYAGELPQGHAIKFVLIDQYGNIRKYFDGTDEASLAVLRKDITNLVKELRS
jgi:protein SCO1/2